MKKTLKLALAIAAFLLALAGSNAHADDLCTLATFDGMRTPTICVPLP